MAAVGRSWVMETRGDYQADASASETTADATPEKVVPMRRGFYMTDNDYVDRLAGVIDGRTGWVLTYLLRQTVGFHRTDFRCSQYQLARALGYSRNTLAAALRELDTLHVVTTDANERGRTQARTFHLEPIESWRLPERCEPTSSKFELVETSAENELDQTSAKFAVVDTTTSSKNEPVAPETSSKFEPHINTSPEKDIPEERNDLLSDASHDALRMNDAPEPEASSTPEKPAPKARKVFAYDSDAYTLAVHLRDSILRHKPDARVPAKDAQLQQWAGVIDLMLRIDGRSPERIRALIDAIMTNPRIAFWRGVILSPGKLRDKFDQIEIQLRERGGYRTSQTPTPPPSSPDTDDALTRKGIETRERLARIRREREAAEAAAAKGVQS